MGNGGWGESSSERMKPEFSRAFCAVLAFGPREMQTSFDL